MEEITFLIATNKSKTLPVKGKPINKFFAMRNVPTIDYPSRWEITHLQTGARLTNLPFEKEEDAINFAVMVSETFQSILLLTDMMEVRKTVASVYGNHIVYRIIQFINNRYPEQILTAQGLKNISQIVKAE